MSKNEQTFLRHYYFTVSLLVFLGMLSIEFKVGVGKLDSLEVISAYYDGDA